MFVCSPFGTEGFENWFACLGKEGGLFYKKQGKKKKKRSKDGERGCPDLPAPTSI